MKHAIRKAIGGKRRGAGRPATGAAPSRTFRLSDEFMAKLDAWAAGRDDPPARRAGVHRNNESEPDRQNSSTQPMDRN